jgi:ATP-dependent helicase/nuclease subunit A
MLGTGHGEKTIGMNPNNQTLSKAADTGKSVHLSASAGSGKTRALKERYLAILDKLDRRGLSIDQAVAITFTDKAAAEIKERVMRDLPEPMLKKIIRGRQDLRISTIHSFCMNLLKRYPLEAGLPPDFGVLDARDQAHKVRKAIEDALEALGRDPEIMGPLRGFTADDLFDLIGFLLSIRSRLKRVEIDAGGPEDLLTSIRAGMDIGQAEAELGALITGTEWRSQLRHMEKLLQSQGGYHKECLGKEHSLLSETQDADAASRIVGSLAPIYFTSEGAPRKSSYITKKAYAGRNREEYEKAYPALQGLLGRFRDLQARVRSGREAVSLLRLYQRAEEKYQDSKLREGLLDFDDLEIYAYHLLKSQASPDILYWLDRKILHFLVDEFQDTSDIQWAILNKLTEEIFAGQGADKPMRPTLFIVGDEKQSIYRFREANYRLIENVRKKMEENIPPGAREILTLDRNFRSVPEVVETVNQVFAALWGETYQRSETDRKHHRGSVRLVQLVPADPEDATPSPTEAEVLAREIKKVIDSGTTVYERVPNAQGNDGQTWNERLAEYKDCAVLIQSRTKLKEYEAALQKEGIPYRVVGGIGFYEEDEIQAVMSVLFSLWNRDDKFSLAAALRSALFGLTDKDIFDLMQDDGAMAAALKRQRPEAWELLHGWERNAGLVPLPDLIHRIISESGAYIRFGRRNPQAIFNLDKLLDTAREFDRRGYTTLQDFVVWVKNIREAEQREATADMNLPGFQGAVSIMTVHKAKGLEFPVVFLPGMNQQPKSVSSGPLAIIEGDGRVRMAVKDDGNPIYEELWGREKEELRREHQRLLYVAMTRARDHLVMIGTRVNGKKPAKENAWLSYLHQTLPALQETGCDQGHCLTTCSYPDWQEQSLPVERAAALPAGQQKMRETVVDGKRVLENISPTTLPGSPEWKKATDFIDHDKEETLAKLLPEAGIQAVSPLTRGSVLHRCLENLTVTGTYDLEQTIKEFPEIDALDKETRELFRKDAEGVLRRVAGAKDLAWVFERGSNAWSELPFLYRRGNTIISGIIDRVVVKGDKGFVVDYKAILIENDQALAPWMDHYIPQIRIYCEAVKEIFRLRSVDGYLLFLDSVKLELTIKI